MKIRSVGAELFHADRRTEGRMDPRTGGQTKLIVAFRICAKAPKTAGSERNVLCSSLISPKF
jgi:hypothetical protein